jgi:xylulose-5-phosphate/fructose-6-phosphate phosphoketolase
LIVAAVVGDGETETAPLATSWHVSKFLSPVRDGAVLPILNLNGYKINNPTLLARMPRAELESLFIGLGWTPYFVEGSEPQSMHQAMAATLERCLADIRSHAPKGSRRMGVSPHANGGALKRALRLPDFRDYGERVEKPGRTRAENTKPLGVFLRDAMHANKDNLRVFGPDETTSNKLGAVYGASKKLWLDARFSEDDQGGELASDGRVIEMLSEHTLEGMLEGYLLSGRHGLLSTYEAFVHVIDSMFNQHAKWLDTAGQISWRAKVASLNLLITSTVWRQDHNGFTHQDPGFLDVVVNKSPRVTRIYLPPDVNCLLSVADHCLRSENYVNVIVCDKQAHLQYLDVPSAMAHCAKGAGIWHWASNDDGVEPDVVMASAGDVPTLEALAATEMLRAEFPDLKIRFVNVVDLFRLQPASEHPHGLSDADFEALFTANKPVVFNFHGYPWLIHRLAYRRANHANLHVRGYKERGNINTPLELAIRNEIDRFTLAVDVIDRVPRLRSIGAHAKERFRNRQYAAKLYAHEHGVDQPELVDWRWGG